VNRNLLQIVGPVWCDGKTIISTKTHKTAE